METIPFDDATADRLIQTLRDVAQQLRSMGWDRWNAVSQAMSDFSGGHAKRFEAACATESTDRGALARALDALADDVEGAKAQARLERERIAAHEAWQERVDERERAEKFAFSGGFPSLAVFPGVEPNTRPLRPPEISASFGPGIRNRYAGGGDAGGKTSAAPASLRSFVSRSRGLTSRMSAGRSDVRGAVAAYTGACSLAPLSVSALLTGFSRLIEENQADEIWIEDVASAFEAAGKGTLGDFDVMLVVNTRHPEELSKLLLGGTLTQAQIAATWAALTKSTDFNTEKFIKKHSFELASLDGLPFSVMSQAGKHALSYALDPEHPENLEKAFARMGFLPGERSMKDFKADLEAVQTALTRAQSTMKEGDVVQLVSFGRHDGVVTAGISMGDLDTASKIGVFVSGMMSDVHGLGDSFDAFKKIRDGDPGIAMVTWVGYRSPNIVEESFQDRANNGAPRLASFLDGIAAQRAGNPVERFVTIGHSYGTNVLAEALKITKAPVDAYVTLGSAGLQYGTTAQDLGVEEIYATHADGDGIAAGIGQHVHFRKASEDGGGYVYRARVDPRDLDGAYEFSSEKDGGGKAVTMHNLLNPIDMPEWMQNLDGVPADQEIGYLNEKSSTVLGLHNIVRGKKPAQ